MMSKLDYQVKIFELAKDNNDIEFNKKFTELNESVLQELGYIDDVVLKLLQHIKRNY